MIRSLASHGPTCALGSHGGEGVCSTSLAWRRGRRRAVRVAYTSTCGSSRVGASPKCAARRWRSLALWKSVASLASSKWWKEERHGVFLDYNQNAKDRTTCSAYSVRPLPDARVSTPLRWDEVMTCDPADFTVLTVPESPYGKIGDPHATMDEHPGVRWTLCSSWPRATKPRAYGRCAMATALSQDGGRTFAGAAVEVAVGWCEEDGREEGDEECCRVCRRGRRRRRRGRRGRSVCCCGRKACGEEGATAADDAADRDRAVL